MPRYTANINVWASISFEAGDDEDAANVAADLARIGGVPDMDIHDVEVDNIEREYDE